MYFSNSNVFFTTLIYYTILFVNTWVLIKSVPDFVTVPDFGKLEFGRCQTRTKDIVIVTRTIYKCLDFCRNRPACKAYSFCRMTGLCRLHTEEGMTEECVGYVYSNKNSWNLAQVSGCDCAEGEVCVPVENETNVFRCEIEECPAPNNPSFGDILGNDVSIGGHIRYRCHQGYIATGQLIRTCQQSGEWSGTQPKCIPEQVCPVVGSTQWGMSCYLIVTIFNDKKTFADAENYCSDGGGYLAAVTSVEENAYVTSNLKIIGNINVSKYWIGIKRSVTNEWIYSFNMSRIGYSAWGKSPGNEDCVAYEVDPASNAWKWATIPCTEIEYFVCEYDVDI